MTSRRSCRICSAVVFLLVFGLVLYAGQQSALVMAQEEPGQDPLPPPDPPPDDTAPPEPDLGRVVVSSGVVAVVPDGSSVASIEESVASALARSNGGATFVVFPSSDLKASTAKTYDDRGFVREYLKPLAKHSAEKAARLLTSLARTSPSSFNRLLSQASRSYGFSCKLFKEKLSKVAKHGESCETCRLKECTEDGDEGEKIEDTELYKCLVELLEEVA